MEGAIAKLPDILQIARDHERDRRGRRLARDRRARQERAAAPPSTSACSARSTSSRRRSAKHSAARRADSSRDRRRLTDYLTQRSRPQLFSNALPPTVAASALAAVRFIEAHPERVETLRDNTTYFREQITEAGFKPLPGETPIVPIIVGETAAAIQMSDMLLDEGVFVTGFGFPVVPHGPGARALPDLGGAHARRSRRGDSGVQEGRDEAGNHSMIKNLA